ncbi:peptidylprolyl isomerase [Shimia sp. R10_1]|uniref:peptidylprolyl isomerase n=1 Tax=Shimia sp. R10_1 TaxID=2821095 RepID=UPI001AD9D219|nr:peptidylprolyl isomerase [Shimia sp. R10_1]MBO9472039.1 peptidylprolyl isomerase [Shimia sp. R10_1]
MSTLKLAAAFALLASPALATGLKIEVAGEGANGTIVVDLFEDVAPQHAARITDLAAKGEYDNVAFHRVIEGFMAQTGDVQYGDTAADYDARYAGRGGSDQPDLPAEFSDLNFDRGVVGMARSQSPNSANSQFFIMFDEGAFLNGNYTVVGKVTEGMDVVDAIKRGHRQSGAITGAPDVMKKVTVTE